MSTWINHLVAEKPVEIFTPETGKPRFAVLFLHPVGEETLLNNPAYTQALAEHQLACVCPYGRRSWWSNRICGEFDSSITAEQHLLQNVVPFMREHWGLGPRAVAVVGISMGGQGAIRLGLKHPDIFPVVAGVASAFDYHEWYGEGTPIDQMYASREQCRQDTAILHIDPYKWPPYLYFCIDPTDLWFRGNDRLHEKLKALGVPHTIDFTTHLGGHCWEYFNVMAKPTLRFVKESLEKVHRQLA
jgi:S-formylglutathione hydrolase